MSEDLEALKKAAEGATPGPWVTRTPHDWDDADIWGLLVFTANGHEITPPGGEMGDDGLQRADAAYIAAASPDVVLALIERVERAEGAVARCAALAESCESRANADRADVESGGMTVGQVVAITRRADNYDLVAQGLRAALGSGEVAGSAQAGSQAGRSALRGSGGPSGVSGSGANRGDGA